MRLPFHIIFSCLSGLYLLLFSVAYSAELKVEGLPAKQKKQILQSLEPRLSYISKRDAAPWRADDASFFLERVMVRSGYPEVKVNWSLPGSNVILLNVRSGPKYNFGDVRATSYAVLDAKDLREYFLQPIVETEAVSSKKAPYIKEFTPLGTANVNNYLKSLGYWHSKVSVLSEIYDKDNGKVDINLSIKQGKLLKLAKPKITGAQEVNIQSYYPEIAEYIGLASSTENINKLKTAIDGFYRKSGYQFAKIYMDVKHEENVTRLIFRVEEGAQYRVNKIIVSGMDKTKPRKVRRFFRHQRGKEYNEEETNDAVAKLISTGAFSSVVAKPVVVKNGNGAQVDLHIEVVEGEARSFRSYAGFGSFEGFIVGGGYTNSNFHGSLRNFYVGGEYSSRGLLGEVGVVENRIFNAPITFQARAFLVQRDFDGYDVARAGLEGSFLWSPDEIYSSRLYGNLVAATATSSSLTAAELGPDDYFVSRVGIEQTVDFRDNKLIPNSGYYAKGLIESGVIAGDAGNVFLRLDFENSYRYTYKEKHQFTVRARVAGIQSDSAADLPVDVRLFAGGSNSHRGFDERDFSPLSVNGDPVGSEAYWLGSLEYVRTISDPIKLVTFFDVGQTHSDFNDFSLSDPTYAVGLGVRLDLPIGPIRLEYGRNLNRSSGEPSGTFHFTIGTTF